jgi:hypothetical protein
MQETILKNGRQYPSHPVGYIANPFGDLALRMKCIDKNPVSPPIFVRYFFSRKGPEDRLQRHRQRGDEEWNWP